MPNILLIYWDTKKDLAEQEILEALPNYLAQTSENSKSGKFSVFNNIFFVFI